MPVSTVREDREQAIQALAEEYPKAFFIVGQRRKPLKLGIEKDIEADLAKANDDSPLLDHDIVDALAWYTYHVGYKNACSVAGTARVDLEGRPVGKVTLSEAREAEKQAEEGFAMIEARKQRQLPQFVTRSPPPSSPPPPPPRLQALPVKANLDALEMLVEIEKQIALVRSILGNDPDDPLRRELARPAMRLMIDELQTIIARQDQKAA
jgi:sRNA-binding protein